MCEPYSKRLLKKFCIEIQLIYHTVWEWLQASCRQKYECD